MSDCQRDSRWVQGRTFGFLWYILPKVPVKSKSYMVSSLWTARSNQLT
jgi:hypothetical protein